MDLSISITNQNKQVVIRGVGKVKVLENPPPTPTVGLHDTSKGVVIITGASRGIGAATAKLLAAQGFKVVINYHSDHEGANEVAAQIKDLGQTAMTWAADVSDRKQVRDMVNGVLTRFSQIDAVVNNATEKLSPVAFEHLSVEDFERHFQVGLCGAFNVVQESLPHLLKAKTPAVVSIGSINADGVPNHALLAYTAMKAALVSMTRSLASEFGPKGIRFNIVSPGMTDTGLISDTSERSRLVAKMQAPLRKLANPDDIAAAISFLLSPGASHITGETLRVCGGAVMI
jgi:3-oxoacyl-[acyl-carrier protein] reductase